MKGRWTTVGGVFLLSSAAVIPGCGGGSSGGGGTGGPNPVPVRNVIIEENFTNLPPDEAATVFIVAFTTTVAGDFDITVDWTFDSNDVDFILARGTLEQAQSAACQGDSADCPLQLVDSALTLSKPEVMSVRSAAAGDYVIAVANFGQTAESGVVVVGLTTTTATNSPMVSATRSTTASSLGAGLHAGR